MVTTWPLGDSTKDAPFCTSLFLYICIFQLCFYSSSPLNFWHLQWKITANFSQVKRSLVSFSSHYFIDRQDTKINTLWITMTTNKLGQNRAVTWPKKNVFQLWGLDIFDWMFGNINMLINSNEIILTIKSNNNTIAIIIQIWLFTLTKNSTNISENIFQVSKMYECMTNKSFFFMVLPGT